MVVGGACAAFALLPAAVPAAAAPSDDFVTVWSVTWDDRTIKIPVGGATGTYAIDWGDGNTSLGVSGDQEHTYAWAGTYTVRISGDFTRILLGGDVTNAEKLKSIDQWGSMRWSSMESAFADARNVRYAADDSPNLSGVSSLSRMFSSAYYFNGDLSGWNTSSVTDMSGMFDGAHNFDADLSGWDISSVTDMNRMFYNAHNFDADLSDWDTSSVTDMNRMFRGAAYFDADLSDWDTSSVTDMGETFFRAYSFSANISDWDTSSVTDMNRMFSEISGFCGDWNTSPCLSGWDTSRVTNMSEMFRSSHFNGDLSGWNTSSVTDMSGMFYNAYYFDADLSGWDTSRVTDMSYMFFESGATPDLSGWNTSSVTDMSGMFYGAMYFNADLSGWNTSSVTDMSRMFQDAMDFNGDISGWDTSSVTDMRGMFSHAYNIAADLSGWDTSSVTDMSEMFYITYEFNSDISGWDVSNVADMYYMFYYASAFSQNLGPWYITLNSTRIGGDGTYAAEIAAQNAVLHRHNPSYSLVDTGAYPDNANFTISSDNVLMIKPNAPPKDKYLINIGAESADSFGTGNTRQLEIYASSHLNRPPAADAGTDQTVSEGSAVSLDGSSSSDPDGDTLSYLWVAPQGITLQNANTAAPSFAAPPVASDTPYTITLAVSDGTDTDTDTMIVTVRNVNLPPTADAGADQTVSEGATVNLNGSSSSDPDGDSLSYSWTAPQGITLQNANTAAPSFAAPSVTSDTPYTITLAVSDGTDTDTDTVIVTVRNVNLPPTADAGADQTVSEGATVNLNGSSSSDPDGDSLSYSWTAPQGITLQNANTAAPSFAAPSVTSDTPYTITLTVSDGTDTDTDTMVVTVRSVSAQQQQQPTNRAPTADAGADLTVREGATVYLSGFASSDPDGDSITYGWTISPSVTLKNADAPAPSFTAPDISADTNYTLTLTVSDGTDTATDTVVVTVENNLPPTADAGADLTVSEGAIVYLNGFASSDPDGDSITYGWTISPPIPLKNADAPAPSFTAPDISADTNYTLTLTVSDGTDTATDTVVVTVRSAPVQ